MRRRRFLATTAALLTAPLAGCSDPRGSLRLEAVESDAALADRYARDLSGLPEEYRRLIVAAIEGDREEATTSGTSPPFTFERPVAYEGRYYEISHEEIGSREEQMYGIEIDYSPPETFTPELGTIAYADLPAVDRLALEPLIPDDDEDRDQGEGFDIGVGHHYSDAEAAESVLVPDQQYDAITHEGNRYRIRVSEGRVVTVAEYRYRAAEVASGDSDLAGQVRERYLFALSGLSGGERDILEKAIGDTYRTKEEPSDAFRSLVDRFRSHDAVSADEYGGEWLARYDGRDYWVDLRYPQSMIQSPDAETVTRPEATPPEP